MGLERRLALLEEMGIEVSVRRGVPAHANVPALAAAGPVVVLDAASDDAAAAPGLLADVERALALAGFAVQRADAGTSAVHVIAFGDAAPGDGAGHLRAPSLVRLRADADARRRFWLDLRSFLGALRAER